MDAELIGLVILGFIIVGFGMKGIGQSLGNTGDKQYGAKYTEQMFFSLFLCVLGLSITMIAMVIHLIAG